MKMEKEKKNYWPGFFLIMFIISLITTCALSIIIPNSNWGIICLSVTVGFLVLSVFLIKNSNSGGHSSDFGDDHPSGWL